MKNFNIFNFVFYSFLTLSIFISCTTPKTSQEEPQEREENPFIFEPHTDFGVVQPYIFDTLNANSLSLIGKIKEFTEFCYKAGFEGDEIVKGEIKTDNYSHPLARTYIYDDKGRPVTIKEYYLSGRVSEETNITYSANLITKVVSKGFFSDGDRYAIRDYTYDNGLMVEENLVAMSGGKSKTTYKYDDHSNLIEQRCNGDLEKKNLYKYESDRIVYKKQTEYNYDMVTIETFSYDSIGALLTKDIDWGANGWLTSYEYNEKMQVLREISINRSNISDETTFIYDDKSLVSD